jgi:hypothetical protein
MLTDFWEVWEESITFIFRVDNEASKTPLSSRRLHANYIWTTGHYIPEDGNIQMINNSNVLCGCVVICHVSTKRQLAIHWALSVPCGAIMQQEP